MDFGLFAILYHKMLKKTERVISLDGDSHNIILTLVLGRLMLILHYGELLFQFIIA